MLWSAANLIRHDLVNRSTERKDVYRKTGDHHFVSAPISDPIAGVAPGALITNEVDAEARNFARKPFQTSSVSSFPIKFVSRSFATPMKHLRPKSTSLAEAPKSFSLQIVSITSRPPRSQATHSS